MTPSDLPFYLQPAFKERITKFAMVVGTTIVPFLIYLCVVKSTGYDGTVPDFLKDHAAKPANKKKKHFKIKRPLRETPQQLVMLLSEANSPPEEESIMILTPNQPMTPATAQLLLDSPALWKRSVSSSGAEYAYFTVGPLPSLQSFVNVELISPAPAKTIARYVAGPRTLALETPADYAAAGIPAPPAWIANILKGTHEQDRTLARTDSFVLQADSKWTDYPLTPTSVYVQAIATDPKLRSLRDVDASSIPLLESIKQTGLTTLKDKYGIDPATVRVFVHYPPQFYQLHVHFCLASNPIADAACERAHLVDAVLSALAIDGDFYKKCALTVVRDK